ncbi:MAG TPA: CinA family protein, partial [Sinorhizobium sp.]|nr:CinA family protein [Sinorhizobium sp.]
MWPADIEEKARAIIADFTGRGLKLATAESCTGGLIASARTEIAGSSSV